MYRQLYHQAKIKYQRTKGGGGPLILMSVYFPKIVSTDLPFKTLTFDKAIIDQHLELAVSFDILLDRLTHYDQFMNAYYEPDDDFRDIGQNLKLLPTFCEIMKSIDIDNIERVFQNNLDVSSIENDLRTIENIENYISFMSIRKIAQHFMGDKKILLGWKDKYTAYYANLDEVESKTFVYQKDTGSEDSSKVYFRVKVEFLRQGSYGDYDSNYVVSLELPQDDTLLLITGRTDFNKYKIKRILNKAIFDGELYDHNITETKENIFRVNINAKHTDHHDKIPIKFINNADVFSNLRKILEADGFRQIG